MKNKIEIIPLPLYVKKEDKNFKLTSLSEVSVIIDSQTNINSAEIKNQLEAAFMSAGLKVSKSGSPVQVEIKKHNPEHSSEEAYELSVSEKGIFISASAATGAFYACISLAQMIAKSDGSLPYVTIKDQPAYKWRGFLLDTSRTFFSVTFIKKMLDACALHKLNIFHWQLLQILLLQYQKCLFPTS